MSLRFTRLNYTSIHHLRPGEKITEHGITAERLRDGDVRYTVDVMAGGKRIRRILGKESEGVTLQQAEELIARAGGGAGAERPGPPEGMREVVINLDGKFSTVLVSADKDPFKRKKRPAGEAIKGLDGISSDPRLRSKPTPAVRGARETPDSKTDGPGSGEISRRERGRVVEENGEETRVAPQPATRVKAGRAAGKEAGNLFAWIIDALGKSKPLSLRAPMALSLCVMAISVSIMFVDIYIGVLGFLNGVALAFYALNLRR